MVTSADKLLGQIIDSSKEKDQARAKAKRAVRKFPEKPPESMIEAIKTSVDDMNATLEQAKNSTPVFGASGWLPANVPPLYGMERKPVNLMDRPLPPSDIDFRLSEIEELTGHKPSSAVRRILERAADCLKAEDTRELDTLRVATDLELKAFDLARKEAQTAKARGATTGGLGQLGRKTNNS